MGQGSLYSCRTVPPPLQTDGLRQADQDIRHSLGRLVGSPLSDDDWRLAQGGSGPAVRLSTLLLLTSPAWLRLRSAALAFGLVLTSTTWTAAS